MKIETDVLVIGGGMAGLVAGTVTAKAGLQTIVVTKGQGATANSSGAIDIIGYLPNSIVPVHSALEGLSVLSTMHPFHPYSFLGISSDGSDVDTEKVVQQVQQACNWFLTESKNWPVRYEGSLLENVWAYTMLGTQKPTAFVQSTMFNSSQLGSPDTILLFAGIKGFSEFRPKIATKSFLDERVLLEEPPRKITNCQLNLSPFGNVTNISAIELARYLDTEKGAVHFIKELKRHIERTSATHVALPPILGVSRTEEIRKILEQSLGVKILELLSFPPSVPGLRLQSALEKMFQSYNGSLFRNHVAVDSTRTGPRIEQLVVKTPRRTYRIIPKAVILATGKFVGGGILGSERGLREAIFGLNVVDATRLSVIETRPQRLTTTATFTPQGNRLFGCGVSVNGTFTPLNISGKCFAENLFCAGAVLAGHNYLIEKSGLGVALTTGFHVGHIVVQQIKEGEL